MRCRRAEEADNKIQQKVKSYNKNFACVMIWLNNNYIALVCQPKGPYMIIIYNFEINQP